MSRRDLPMRLLRTVVIPIALLCAVAAATPLAAQQAPDSARVVPASTAQPSAPSPTLAGPRVSSPRFQRYEPSLARSDAPASSLAVEGGSHTIVISTLALVLIVIIIVLLVK
jgi:hypothetical protein